MPTNVKISQLPVITTITSTDVIPAVKASSTSQISVQNLAASLPTVTQSLSASYVNGNIFVAGNSATSASYALSASFAVSSSLARTSSYVSGSTFTSGNPALSASYALSSSFALTASYVANASSFPFNGAAVITGSLVISGSAGIKLTVLGDTLFTGSVGSTGGFTGSLRGTADSASFVNNLVQNVIITGSLTISGSPAPEIRVIGEMAVTGSLIVSGSNGAGIFSQGATLVDYVDGISNSGSYMVWRAPFSCSVVALYGYYVGGTAPQVNALRSGSSGTGRITGSNLTVSSANVWTAAIKSFQNSDFNEGDGLAVIMSGSANNQLAVQVDFIRKF